MNRAATLADELCPGLRHQLLFQSGFPSEADAPPHRINIVLEIMAVVTDQN
jgi:hypothetical protein